MSVQPTPPVQLEPSMDNGHQLAFINQNFQSIANVLQQNSLVIVASGTASITSAGSSATGTQQVDLSQYGLTSPPIVLAFSGSSSLYNPLPQVTGYGFSGGNMTIQGMIFITEITNTSFFIFFPKSDAGSATYSIKWFVFQQTAN